MSASPDLLPAPSDRRGARAVLGSPGVPRALGTALLGRLPSGSGPLALLLFARGNGLSIAQAGLLVAVFAGGTAIGSPALARAADRLSQPPVLIGSALVSTIGFIILALFGARGLGIAILGALLAGFGAPPLEACLRALWPDLLREYLVQSGYALDVASQELIFVIGPVVTLAAVSMGGSDAGLIVAAAIQLVGAIGFATSHASRAWRGIPGVRHWLGPLREHRLVVLLIGVILTGAAVGATTVAVAAYAEASGGAFWAGWLLAVQAAGALAGGLAYSRWAPPDGVRLLPVFGIAFCLGYLPLIATPPVAVALLVVPLSGVALPPMLTAVFMLVDRLAPPGTVTEGFAWVATAFLVGSAAGSAIDGAVIVASGVRAGFCVAPVCALLAVGIFSILLRYIPHLPRSVDLRP
jgi:predicted MFS family arabinose efflux permease